MVMYRGEWQTTHAATNSSRPGPGGSKGSSWGRAMACTGFCGCGLRIGAASTRAMPCVASDVLERCPHPTTNAASPIDRTTLLPFRVTGCLLHLQVDPLDHIPHESTAVPLLRALGLSDRICRASHESILPAPFRRPVRPPSPPRVLSDLRVQASLFPGGTSVGRDVHSCDAVTRIEGNTLDFIWASRTPNLIGLGTNEDGAHVESIDGNGVRGQMLWRFGAIWSVGDAIGFVRPEVAEDLRQHGDVAESFHPVGPIPTGHDETQGEAVDHGQRLVVHRISDHHLSISCVVDRKGFCEGSHRRQRRRVKTSERDVHRARLHLGTIQDRPHGNAGPSGVADCAILPLAAWNARLEEATRIARALIDRDDRQWLELRTKVVHAQLQRRPDVATDVESKRSKIHRSRDSLEVPPNEESFVRREVLSKVVERGFKL